MVDQSMRAQTSAELATIDGLQWVLDWAHRVRRELSAFGSAHSDPEGRSELNARVEMLDRVIAAVRKEVARIESSVRTPMTDHALGALIRRLNKECEVGHSPAAFLGVLRLELAHNGYHITVKP